MPKVFISYSHKDEDWKERLQTQLTVLEMEGLLSIWEDRQIDEGDAWYPEIEQALNEADVAILLISADFLTSRFIRGEEIPRLLERREKEGVRVIPLILKPCLWDKVPWLSALQGASRDNVELSGFSEHEQDKALSRLARRVHDLLPADEGSPESTPEQRKGSHAAINIDRLPTVKGEFFGREAELQMLSEAWLEGGSTNIIQFIAPGGTGKTKMLRYWINHTDGINALIAWSFYSQGASEDKQVSASPFLTHALEKLGSTRTHFASEENRGEHLADLLHRRRCLLVLDGLEPLQHAGTGMRGEIKDRAIRQLLKNLAGQNNDLCIITTRIAVHELSDRSAPAVISHDLQNLAVEDGVKLLESLGVNGRSQDLAKAVQDYGCHALALNLLGNVLRLRHHGDVLKRDTIKALVNVKGNRVSQHAFRMMQVYEEWFEGEPELALLHLLGLFDHPVGLEVLRVLWEEQIPNLTAGLDEDEWLQAIEGLREEHHLLSQHDDGNDLDCHPLIREWFGRQLQKHQPEAWRQAHERLYDYYRVLPEKEQPDTLEEMRPLFSAVAHGCAAGLHQRAFHEVYWTRIKRKEVHYLTKILGAFSDDLATVVHFFNTPWHTPEAGLGEVEQAAVLSWAGFRLRALGRLREALEPMQASLEMLVEQEDWRQAAPQASNLSELQLTLGDVAQAVQSGQRSVEYADRSKDSYTRLYSQTTHADAQHQAGEVEAALALFREAERLQQEWQPSYQRLYSLQGFRYCNLLLAEGVTMEVLERAEQTLEWVTDAGQEILSVAMDQLTLGRTCHQQALSSLAEQGEEDLNALAQAAHWLDQAVAGLRAAGAQHHLPRGLLTRAALYRHTGDFTRARGDLQEVFDIAEPSEMRLHLTDYHLELARLLLAENDPVEARQHADAAEQLTDATGYKRRLPELAELRERLDGLSE